ncbi:hypothetical protein ZMO02_00100 [Zymomonas mobilis subsp. pomaceae]|nr:hypothetical protein ZMO02_00100 [Zymomonas mobilis subsp. pomaceae]
MLKAQDHLNIALQLEPPSLNPTSGASAAIDEVSYGTIFEGLVRLSRDSQPEPWLATGWQISADGRDYIFTLKPHVTFSDGSPFNAESAAFSLNHARAATSTNVQQEALSVIEKIEVISPLKLHIRLKQPDSFFLTLLGLPDCVMISPQSASNLATAPVGTGPFRLDFWHHGDQLQLVARSDYWGKYPPLKTLDFLFITDPFAAYAAIKTGRVDFFANFPAPENMAELAKDSRLKLLSFPSEGEVILAFNQHLPLFQNRLLRQAISLAINRPALIDAALYGYGRVIGSHFPPQNPDYLDLTGYYKYNPEKAQQRLKQAGYPNGLSLNLDLPPSSYATRSGEMIADQLAKIGIHVTIHRLEWMTWLDQVYQKHNFQMTIVSHAEPFDYMIYGKKNYYFGYHNPVLNRLLEEIHSNSDPIRRHRLLQDVQKTLTEDAANVFLFQAPHLVVAKKDLEGLWRESPTQPFDLTQAYFSSKATNSSQESVSDTRGKNSFSSYVLKCSGIAGLFCILLLIRYLGLLWFLKKLVLFVLTLWVASLIIFGLLSVLPGDPAAYMMGLEASPRAIAAVHAEFDLNGAAYLRYSRWLSHMMQGDLGLSFGYHIPVTNLINEALSVSMPLVFCAFVMACIGGVILGFLVAFYYYRPVGPIFLGLTRMGLSLPSFWLAILLLYCVLHFQWSVMPNSHPSFFHLLTVKAFYWPVTALAVPQATWLARAFSQQLLALEKEDFMLAARARGLSRNKALLRHAARHALPALLPLLSLSFPAMLAGAVIVENIFSLAGIGRLLLQAITMRDLILIQAIALLLVAITLFMRFLSDLIHPLIDPRLRQHL